MGGQRSANEARCPRAKTSPLALRKRRLAQGGMVREAKVVVGGKIDQFTAVTADFDPLRALHRVEPAT